MLQLQIQTMQLNESITFVLSLHVNLESLTAGDRSRDSFMQGHTFGNRIVKTRDWANTQIF